MALSVGTRNPVAGSEQRSRSRHGYGTTVTSPAGAGYDSETQSPRRAASVPSRPGPAGVSALPRHWQGHRDNGSGCRGTRAVPQPAGLALPSNSDREAVPEPEPRFTQRLGCSDCQAGPLLSDSARDSLPMSWQPTSTVTCDRDITSHSDRQVMMMVLSPTRHDF